MKTTPTVPSNGRSGGKVDAAGKRHRKAPPALHGIKKSDLQLPKLRLAKEVRQRRHEGA